MPARGMKVLRAKAAEGTSVSAGSRQAEGTGEGSLKQGQTKVGHTDKTAPQRKQVAAAHEEFQVTKPKKGGQGAPDKAEGPREEAGQAKDQEQAGVQG